MALILRSTLLLGALSNTVLAVPWEAPARSTTFIPSTTESLNPPEVTETVSSRLPSSLHVLEILKRQQTTVGSNTCGWLSGYQNAPITCGPDRICINDRARNAHGCCTTDVVSLCSIATTCIASSDLPVLCPDAACSQNNDIQKCFLSASPECFTRYYITSNNVFTAFGCAPSPYSATVLSTFVAGFNSTKSSTIPSSSQSSIESETKSSLTSTTSAALAAASVTSTAQSKHKNGLSGGAIAGIVIGVLAALALFAIAVLLFLRQKKGSDQDCADSRHDPTAHAVPYHDYASGYPAMTSTSSHVTSPAPCSEYSESVLKDPQVVAHELPARGYSVMAMHTGTNTQAGTPVQEVDTQYYLPDNDNLNRLSSQNGEHS